MPASQVPTLDLRDFQQNKEEFVEQLKSAYHSFGFCSFVGHNLDQEMIKRAYVAAKDFFNLPPEVKKTYHSAEMSGKRGYVPFKVETAKGSNYPDLKEFWHTGQEHPPVQYLPYMSPNMWPKETPHFKQSFLDLYSALHNLGVQVLRPMSLAVGMDEDYFGRATAHGNSILRALHYPPVSATDKPCIRAQAHEDAGLITLLIAAEGAGLELLTRQGEWIPVNPPKGSVIVNVGDMMQRITNHFFPSTTHRVVNPEGDMASRSRYSLPFFMDPNPDFVLETLKTCVSSDNPNKYSENILANDFLLNRLREIKVSL